MKGLIRAVGLGTRHISPAPVGGGATNTYRTSCLVGAHTALGANDLFWTAWWVASS